MEFMLTINNPSEAAYKYVIFQKLPDSRHCVSVIWKTGDVPPKVPSPITWQNDLGCALGTREEAQYTQDEVWDVELHTRWELEYDLEKNTYVLTPVPDVGTSISDDVIIENRTGKELNIGLAMDNIAALFMEGILSNENVLFRVNPLYFIGILDPTKTPAIGQVVTSTVGVTSNGILTPEDMLALCPVSMNSRRHMALANISMDREGKLDISISYISS